MKKIEKLRICNCSLLVLTVAILASGIQLEATDSAGLTPVWIHVAIGLAFMAVVAYHVFLHFGKSNWFSRFRKQKSPVTRILWWVGLITLLTGLIAWIHWLTTFTHAPIGGVHGKIGFLMIILAIGHICKRIKLFKNMR